MKKKYRTVAQIVSFTDPSKKYTIKVDESGKYSCSCPSWIFNHEHDRRCKHTRAVENCPDVMLEMAALSGKYTVTIEDEGVKWILEKKEEK